MLHVTELDIWRNGQGVTRRPRAIAPQYVVTIGEIEIAKRGHGENEVKTGNYATVQMSTGSEFILDMSFRDLADLLKMKNHLQVNGTSSEGTLEGDAEGAPFYVFDSDKQDWVAGPFPTRAEAQEWIGESKPG